MTTPSKAAARAALLIQDEMKAARIRTGFIDVIPGTDAIGAIIDREFASEEAVEIIRTMLPHLEQAEHTAWGETRTTDNSQRLRATERAEKLAAQSAKARAFLADSGRGNACGEALQSPPPSGSR